MGYFAAVAPWAILVIYFITFAVVAIAFQSVDFGKIIKKDQSQMGIIIYLIVSIAVAFLVASFITIIIGASQTLVHGVTL